MRVANSMITDLVTRNLERSLEKFMNLQGQMSTGRKLNRPSDDPVGAQKDLKYREILTQISQFQKNIASSKSLLDGYESSLSEIQNLLSETYQQAVASANDDNDTSSRIAAAHVIESNYESLLSLGNSQVSGRYIYSGFRTSNPAFIANGSGVRYVGDRGSINVEIESSSRLGVNLIGADILLSEILVLGENSNLQSGISTNTLLADLNLGEGIDLSTGTFTVADNNSGISVTVDISTAVTIGDLIALVNTQLALGGITNLGLDLGQENNNLSWTTLDTGLVTANTPLKNLNSGSGVNLDSGGIRIHDEALTISVDIDLSSALTLGDAINSINSQLATAGINNVTAAINVAGTGIDIVDTNAISLNLSISELGEGATTASDLGILGDIDPVLNGADLYPELDFSVTESGTGETLAAELGLAGNFSLAKAGDPLEPILKLDTPLALLKNGLGMSTGEIKISQGTRQVIFDLDNPAYITIDDLLNGFNSLGLDITASINDSQTGIQIISDNNAESLKIEEVGDGRTAHDFGIYGSPDIMGSMQLLIDALKNDDGESISQLIGNFEKGGQSIGTFRGNVGSMYRRLENTESRLTDQDYSFTKLLSDVEDADLTKLVTDLAMQENSYQAALIATAKIIQPSLLNFLD
ncbi:MAG: flagellar hook-associated protein FlgL [Candidatus Zixiibacteriota bacterium]